MNADALFNRLENGSSLALNRRPLLSSLSARSASALRPTGRRRTRSGLLRPLSHMGLKRLPSSASNTHCRPDTRALSPSIIGISASCHRHRLHDGKPLLSAIHGSMYWLTQMVEVVKQKVSTTKLRSLYCVIFADCLKYYEL